MPETRTPVETVSIDYFCDEPKCCGTMTPTGLVLMSSPPQYVHKCDMCGIEQNLNRSYPYIHHIPIVGEDL